MNIRQAGMYNRRRMKRIAVFFVLVRLLAGGVGEDVFREHCAAVMEGRARHRQRAGLGGQPAAGGAIRGKVAGDDQRGFPDSGMPASICRRPS